jgi:hypothetical protein
MQKTELKKVAGGYQSKQWSKRNKKNRKEGDHEEERGGWTVRSKRELLTIKQLNNPLYLAGRPRARINFDGNFYPRRLSRI